MSVFCFLEVLSRKKVLSNGKVLSKKKVLSFKEKKTKADVEKELADLAIKSFEGNLAKMREVADVKTICMHGSPLSKWDNRLLWNFYDS